SSSVYVSTGGISGLAPFSGTQTLEPQPGPISSSLGTFFFCPNICTTFSDPIIGRVYTSDNPSVAYITAGNTICSTPSTFGTADIYYTIASACSTFVTV